jgi:hypothetical protein
MIRFFAAVLACAAFAGLASCAAPPAPSAAEQAEAATCTAQADATYNAQNYDNLSRTSNANLRYSGLPTHVFDAQNLGAIHARDSQIATCEQNGETGGPGLPGAVPVTPRIITTP